MQLCDLIAWNEHVTNTIVEHVWGQCNVLRRICGKCKRIWMIQFYAYAHLRIQHIIGICYAIPLCAKHNEQFSFRCIANANAYTRVCCVKLETETHLHTVNLWQTDIMQISFHCLLSPFWIRQARHTHIISTRLPSHFANSSIKNIYLFLHCIWLCVTNSFMISSWVKIEICNADM